MLENIGLAVCTETPCVVVDVQRAGPSTGLPTLGAQGDMMQARWGSHGHYEIIALAPASPQEIFYQTIEAFNLSETYRVPVMIMTDEMIGHLSERVVIPGSQRHSHRLPSQGQRKKGSVQALSSRVPTVWRPWPLPAKGTAFTSPA